MDENEFFESPENPESQTPGSEQPTGYTVTPQGSFYTVPHDAIIQDEPAAQPEDPAEPEQPAAEPERQPPKSQYRPYTSAPFYAAQEPYRPYYQPKEKKKKEPHRVGVAGIVIAALLAALIGAFGGAAAMFQLYGGRTDAGTSAVSNNNGTHVNIKVEEVSAGVVEAVAKKCTSGVVGIRTTTSVENFFFGSQEATGEGSGVIYSSDGYVITNYHVIESVVESSSSARIDVYLDASDSDPYPAKVVGYNISTDLAVIKIDAKGLPAIECGNSDDLSVGQFVVTIGSPGGLEYMGSVTYGVISGLDRVVSTSDVKLIQTDAAINPGNSGGALLNTEGKLIGINSSKIVSTEFEGMGFSIPVNTVLEKCKKIIEKKSTDEAYIGITVSKKYTEEILNYYGYPAGAVVQSVDGGSPADKAGIERGDIITEYNGKKVTSAALFAELVSESTPGKKVKVKIYRSGRYYSTNITVASNN